MTKSTNHQRVAATLRSHQTRLRQQRQELQDLQSDPDINDEVGNQLMDIVKGLSTPDDTLTQAINTQQTRAQKAAGAGSGD